MKKLLWVGVGLLLALPIVGTLVLTQAMLGMKKLDIAGLERAWAGG